MRALWIVGISICFGTFAALILNGPDWLRARGLLYNAQVTEGRIVSANIGHRQVEYSFGAGTGTYTQVNPVGNNVDYAKLKPGDTVTVFYRRDDPNVSSLVAPQEKYESEIESFRTGLAFFSLAPLLILPFILFANSYKIANGKLTFQLGPLAVRRVDLRAIEEARVVSGNPLFVYFRPNLLFAERWGGSLSKDKVLVTTNRGLSRRILLHPKDPTSFVAELDSARRSLSST
jgi:hypothetical protein